MGMGIGTRLYPLPGGDGDETKGWYPLGLGMRMEMNFFLRRWVWDSETRACPVPLPSLIKWVGNLFIYMIHLIELGNIDELFLI